MRRHASQASAVAAAQAAVVQVWQAQHPAALPTQWQANTTRPPIRYSQTVAACVLLRVAMPWREADGSEISPLVRRRLPSRSNTFRSLTRSGRRRCLHRSLSERWAACTISLRLDRPDGAQCADLLGRIAELGHDLVGVFTKQR